MRVQAAERADWRAGEVQALVGLARGHADSPNAEDNTHDDPHDAPVCGLRAEALGDHRNIVKLPSQTLMR
jgi:hypothetical protein